MQRKINLEDNIMRHRHKNWFLLNVYKAYAKDEISVLSIHRLMMKINLVSENTYPRDALFIYNSQPRDTLFVEE